MRLRCGTSKREARGTASLAADCNRKLHYRSSVAASAANLQRDLSLGLERRIGLAPGKRARSASNPDLD
jgi:hypothetical protein